MTLTIGRPARPAGAPPATVIALSAHARSVTSEQREAFAAALAALAPSEGLIVVHTCHRVEAYVAQGSCATAALPEPPAGTLRLEDAEAVTHLISVACGVDSVVLGEDQILHQLRETLAARHASLPLDPLLDRLFQAALHAGRRARAWFSGSPRSLADVALDRIARDAGPLEGRRVLVVGTGAMGRLSALAAARRGAHVLVMNRTDERAGALAHEISGDAIPFASDGLLTGLDGVVAAVAGAWLPGPADSRALVASRAVVVDLSSPPSVPAGMRDGLGDRFVSVDDLATAPEAEPHDRLRRRLEGLVSETGRDYCHWLRTREAVPAIQAMAETAELHRRDEVDWLLRRLDVDSVDDRQLIEQMSHRLVAAILHAPLAALNADDSGDLERAARDLFGL